MGEEVQKPPEEEKKPEEAKKPDEKEKKPEQPPADKPSGDGGDAGKKEEEPKSASEESKDPPPPPPPQEIVLRVFMHCEGCARKVRRCLKGFQGVEDVITDCKTHKVVVKGEKADPLKVLDRVQKKSHRQVELLSPIPKPPADEPKKEEAAKPEEKKEEPQVITVVLKVHMHCEACAQEIRKRILRMKGVESAEPDLKSSQVTVRGTFGAANLVEYVYKKTGKQAVIVKQDPPPPEKKEEEDKGKDGKEDEKKGGKDGGEKKDEKKEEGGDEKKEGGGGDDDKAAKPAADSEDGKVVELRKNEFYYYYPQNYQVYPARFAAESYSAYAYPPAPQLFSDENPNACSVM